jgi:hypothetical protein
MKQAIVHVAAAVPGQIDHRRLLATKYLDNPLISIDLLIYI